MTNTLDEDEAAAADEGAASASAEQGGEPQKPSSRSRSPKRRTLRHTLSAASAHSDTVEVMMDAMTDTEDGDVAVTVTASVLLQITPPPDHSSSRSLLLRAERLSANQYQDFRKWIGRRSSLPQCTGHRRAERLSANQYQVFRKWTGRRSSLPHMHGPPPS